MKRLITQLTIVGIMFILSIRMADAAMPTPMKNTYIHDFANVLSSSMKEELNNYSEQLDKGTGAEIMVVTVDNINREEPKMYATKMIRSWGIGNCLFLWTVCTSHLRSCLCNASDHFFLMVGISFY